MRDTQRGGGAETQAEGEAGSMQEAGRGTQSQVSRITPWADLGGAKPLSLPGCPCFVTLIFLTYIGKVMLGPPECVANHSNFYGSRLQVLFMDGIVTDTRNVIFWLCLRVGQACSGIFKR